jgi:DNA ligase-1
MRAFAETADRIAATTKKLEKTAILADYLKSIPVEEAAVAAVFFSGRPFPVWEETTLQVGGTLLWRIVADLSGRTDDELTGAYRKQGDLGAVAGAVLPERNSSSGGGGPRLPSGVQTAFRQVSAARGPAAKAAIVRELLGEVSPLEAKYIIKIMTGDLRIGLKESLVEEAIAGGPGAEPPARPSKLAESQKSSAPTCCSATLVKPAPTPGRLADAKMRLFHPLIVASPAESTQMRQLFQNAWAKTYTACAPKLTARATPCALFAHAR